jgi:hypothetical protein
MDARIWRVREALPRAPVSPARAVRHFFLRCSVTARQSYYNGRFRKNYTQNHGISQVFRASRH